MTSNDALTTAIRVLGWLAGNDELLPIFLGASGASLNDLKAQAEDPAFLASTLDFILMDDAWVIAFCDAENVPYETPMLARQALPGAEQVHWT
ncbi:MAG: DUF3572 domain-containing protein [Pseudoruegeria sp.]